MQTEGGQRAGPGSRGRLAPGEHPSWRLLCVPPALQLVYRPSPPVRSSASAALGLAELPEQACACRPWRGCDGLPVPPAAGAPAGTACARLSLWVPRTRGHMASGAYPPCWSCTRRAPAQGLPAHDSRSSTLNPQALLTSPTPTPPPPPARCLQPPARRAFLP